jgi:hypothetical protein
VCYSDGAETGLLSPPLRQAQQPVKLKVTASECHRAEHARKKKISKEWKK